jgi:tRNA A-37 threonylcarbamoyl transferase component Bud32
MNSLLSKEPKKDVFNLCRQIAASHELVAACLYGPYVCGYGREKGDLNVLLVLSGFRPALRSYHKSLNGIDVFILTVERGAFEKDVKAGWLGEFAAEKVMVPYEPLYNEEYLSHQEVLLKRRIVWELLENIVLGFPESSHELIIKPEYFLYETIMQRSKLFLPITFRFLNMLRSDVKERNVKQMMRGFSQALKELAEEKWISFYNEHVKITHKFIRIIRSRRIRVPSFLRSIQRAAFFHVFSVLPKMMSPLQREEEIFMKTHRDFRNEDLTLQLEDPKKYLFMPTPLGPVPLSDETTIEEFVRRNVPGGKMANLQVSEMGGVLNTAYLLSFRRNHEEHKIVVKKFKDWFGFKWFPLALWALGTKSFAVLGQSRLEREYALSQFLYSQGWPVPRVLYISPKERLIFKEFVEGENLSKIIQRVLTGKEKATEEIALIKTVGKRIAEAHRLGVALGDCKPENVIVTKDGTPYFVDLEQASHDGNQAWDIAEFLYYSGHYVSPIASADAAELVAKEFIRGYLEAEGKKETIKKAGSARYTKVFSIFTPPHIILAISNLCKKMGKE